MNLQETTMTKINPVSQAVRDATAQAQEAKPATPPVTETVTRETLADIRHRAAADLAEEFGTDIDEWLV
jgi:hypothetical protein